MRKFSEVEQDFAARLAALPTKPCVKYIAYNLGEVFHTDSYEKATQFSPKKVIETILADPAELKEWRAEKYALQAEISAQWKKELFAEGGLTVAISERIMKTAEDFFPDDTDDLAEKFLLLADMVDDCITMTLNV